MIQVLVHHEVADYQRWRAAFDAALEFRHDGGEQSCRIFRRAGNPNDLTLLFDWDNLEKAQHYITCDELSKKMREAGVLGVPEVHYMAEMYTVRRSAAD